ncbi:hypothetical protein SCOCK_340080 [Actinacidiphila cocklensis]|uniref:Uncharacterized protein n=1 Tax=Actinacidiphila cocklensis TaxID=887465 RepID=A0A9W4DT07_9ACTN|nr:hypothetical protein SCOCK_340080 [Actinacidiphila cocklensis]
MRPVRSHGKPYARGLTAPRGDRLRRLAGDMTDMSAAPC